MSAALTATASHRSAGSGDAKKSKPKVQVTRRKGQPKKTRGSDTIADGAGNTVADVPSISVTTQPLKKKRPVADQKNPTQQTPSSDQGPIIIDTEAPTKRKSGAKPATAEKRGTSSAAKTKTARTARKKARPGLPNWIWWVIIGLASTVLLILLITLMTKSGPFAPP